MGQHSPCLVGAPLPLHDGHDRHLLWLTRRRSEVLSGEGWRCPCTGGGTPSSEMGRGRQRRSNLQEQQEGSQQLLRAALTQALLLAFGIYPLIYQDNRTLLVASDRIIMQTGLGREMLIGSGDQITGGVQIIGMAVLTGRETSLSNAL